MKKRKKKVTKGALNFSNFFLEERVLLVCCLGSTSSLPVLHPLRYQESLSLLQRLQVPLLKIK